MYGRIKQTQLLNQVNNLEKHLKPISREDLVLQNFTKFQEAALTALKEPLHNLSQWSKLSLIFVAISIMLILVGAAFAIFGNIQTSVLTTVSSILTSFISYILYSQIRLARKAAKESRIEILGQLERAGEPLFEAHP